MTPKTPLDAAHAKMAATPEDETARRAFYQHLADTELLLLLAEDPREDVVTPRLFDLTDGRFAAVFDDPGRISDFAGGGTAPFAVLTGRMLAGLLRGQGIGVALNPGVADSEFLMPPEAIDWLHEVLGAAPDQVADRVGSVLGPTALPDPVCDMISDKLASAAGLVRQAWMATASYESGATGELLGLIDVHDGARDALGRAVAEALAMSGLDGATIGVGFYRSDSAVAAQLVAKGRPVPLPGPGATPAPAKPRMPGSDPDRPPILK